MFLWMTGRLKAAGYLALLMAMVPAAAPGQVTTSCELPLVVPAVEDVELVLAPTMRGPGVQLTWRAPDDASSTCTALTDTQSLGIPLVLDGDYADDFDRTLIFAFTSSGTVGSDVTNRFVCSWNNGNQTQTGRIGGEFNLSNTGGLWVVDGSGVWSQRNGGLPAYLPYTNLIDLVASDDGTLVTALSSGAQIQNDPQGVFRALPGGAWVAVAPELFGRTRRLSAVAARPDDPLYFAVGTTVDGLYITNDGGVNFEQWTGNLDENADFIPTTFDVTALTWSGNRILVAVSNFGSFVSTDDGGSFTPFDNLAASDGSVLVVRTFAEDAGNAHRILVGTTALGVYESLDDGDTWNRLEGNYPFGISPTVLSIEADPDDADWIVIGTSNQGIWYTTDHGANWIESTTPFVGEDIKPEVWDTERHDGVLLAVANDANQPEDHGLFQSVDGGQNWTLVDPQPLNRLGQRIVSTAAGLLHPTTGGGIYTHGTRLSVSSTMTSSATAPEYLGMELGVFLTFGDGSVTLEEVDGVPVPRTFNAVCQDYQGWVVWRSESGDLDNMAMIGRFDKNNPETCIVGYCGDESIALEPNCFAERRAACFRGFDDGRIGFYDGDIYNGFTYLYSVTPFDYGDISMVTDPVALSAPMVFPNRYPDDPNGVGDGEGNRQSYQVNASATEAGDGDEVYVFPNPLRRGSGIAGNEGEEVIWTNLPPDSRIDVFTLSGEFIVSLPEEGRPQEGGNIYWITRNFDNQLLASGIYMWRVTMPERGDFWGKLAIIR